MLDDKALFNPDDIDWKVLTTIWSGPQFEGAGRLLRAHLIVEHFMNEHLQARNPNLENFEDARLGFSHKLTLLGNRGVMSLLAPGIRRINVLRNYVAHELGYQVTKDDVAPFFAPGPYFRSFLSTWQEARDTPVPTPIDIVEAFAQFATLWLHTGTALNARMKEIEAEMAIESQRLREERARLDGEQAVLNEWQASLADIADEET